MHNEERRWLIAEPHINGFGFRAIPFYGTEDEAYRWSREVAETSGYPEANYYMPAPINDETQ